MVWQDPATGGAQVWFLGGSEGTQLLSAASIAYANRWRIVAAADFNQDGHPDVVWQNPATGKSAVWMLGGAQGISVIGSATLSANNNWRPRSCG